MNAGRSWNSSHGPGGPGSRSRSNSIISIFMPPTPSVIEWCTLSTSAAPPPSSPSTTVYSHRGRARSKPAIAALRARSSTHSNEPGSGARTRRRWYERSNCGSADQHGGPTRHIGVTTRWRRRGMRRLPRSTRSTSASQSGLRSRVSTVTTVERSVGSFSTVHMSASASLIWRSNSPDPATGPDCATRRTSASGRRWRASAP